MSNRNIIKIEVPSSIQTNSNTNLNKNQKDIIERFKNEIQLQLDEIKEYQDEEINSKNKDAIEKLVLATEDLISNCMDDSIYLGNKDDNFGSLIFVYQKISLKLETYRLENKIKEINNSAKKYEERIKEAEERNNNLVYNLLGFLTAFSIVSSVVGVVTTIKGTINIMIFMVFVLLILLTTLIGLHNFYKNDNKRENKLQDNYFLWKFALVLLVLLVIVLIFNSLIENKDAILKLFDNRIERIINEKLEIINNNMINDNIVK